MDLWLTVNMNSVSRIVDYFLPTDQENLDFAMLDPAELMPNSGKCKEKSQQERQLGNERRKREREACMDYNTGFATFLAGSVYLDARKAAFISSSIKVEVELRDATTTGRSRTFL